MFEVEQKSWPYSHVHRNYLPDPRLKRLRHINVAEQATYFWPIRFLVNTMHARTCSTSGEIKSKHFGRTSNIFKVLRLPQDVWVFRTCFRTSGIQLLLRSEQKTSRKITTTSASLLLYAVWFRIAVLITFQWTRHKCYYQSKDGLLVVTWSRCASLRDFRIWRLFGTTGIEQEVGHFRERRCAASC